MPAPPPSPATLTILLPRYVPTTRNQTKGAHWSVHSSEKKRAGMALQHALRSGLLSIQSDHVISTGGISNTSKTALSELRSSLTTAGKCLLEGSSPERFTRKKTNAPKSKSSRSNRKPPGNHPGGVTTKPTAFSREATAQAEERQYPPQSAAPELPPEPFPE